MLILAVDTSSRECSVAVLRDEQVLASRGGASDAPYAARLFQDVDSAMGEANVELPQIELFAVATGPGSFTGLRVGLAAVKGWAEVFGRPVAGVSVLEAVAVQAQAAPGIFSPVMDARGGRVFGALFRRSSAEDELRTMGEEVVLGRDEYFGWVAEQLHGETPLFVTTTAEVVKAGLAASVFAGARLEEVSGELAPFVGRLGLTRSRRGELVDSLGLEANYVRRSDAELKRQGG
jgi:tRNA threonylcarbamoyladenosine biosynthesis protein TsaB